MPKILFLGGPSGVGKSRFASRYLVSRGWLHIEIDRFPDGDGIDMENLRSEWNDFLERRQPAPLHAELVRRAGSTSHCVVTFPSNVVFEADHLQVAQKYFYFSYLFGSPAVCLREFLNRERAIGRNLGADHWNAFAPRTYGCLALSFNHSLLVPAFDNDGIRRADADIFQDLLRHIGEA